MKKLLLAVTLASAGAALAPAAHAIRPCEPLEIECHKTCTLPQGGIKDPYWVSC
ncbi:MAG TPA: hypothetical protein VGX28_14825 [Frankiaceae bacterium]|jgi:hypothetical protein|nr:hypothetical protein [Frankiaceae bacterium]